jgi:transcriptional/translational regulatory protein YebC/TACO1
VLCAIGDFDTVSQALSAKEIPCISSELVYLPTVNMPVTDIDTARKVLHLIQVLDDLEDVKAVHTNMELAEGLTLD